MKRRDFMKQVGAGVGAVALNGTQSASAQQPKPGGGRLNVILYVVDDQGTDDAGCYGNPVIHTPGLDRLASEGTRFSSAYTTVSSCSPSRSVLLTGMYCHANGMYGLQHSYHHFSSFDTIHSLPNMLRDGGYRTMCAGKYHVAPEKVYHFDEYHPVRAPKDMADQCRDFIAAQNEGPFFLYFCTKEPHRKFHHEGYKMPDPKDVIVPSYLPDTKECREELAQYYASVERADSGLGQLIDILHETKHWDDTMIIYLSDNGIPFPGAKTTVYEPGLRLPCVVRHPGQKKTGGVCNAFVNWADIAPTILEATGVKPERETWQGRSFLDVLEEENPPDWDEVYASHVLHEVTMYYPMRMVRKGRYKLIWNLANELEYPFASDLWHSRTWQALLKRGDKMYAKRSVEAYLHRPRFELYDLETDPDEVHNLADDPAHAIQLASLKQKLRDFQERTHDPWVLKWERE